jgi:hypothetical protein
MAISSDSGATFLMNRVLAKEEIAILQQVQDKPREKRPWFAMTIEQKPCSIQQCAKTGKLRI